MASLATAHSGLLPAAAAAAVMVRGLHRMFTRAGHASAPPQPKEIPQPDPRPVRRNRIVPDGTCESCGTSIPGNQRICPWCERKLGGNATPWSTTALHWLVFVVLMGALFGGAALYLP